MKFFIDTADIKEIKDLAATGMVDGVTTNPSLAAKSGKKFLDLVRDRSVFLEEYARKMIAEEEQHLGEVNKMLRKPGEIARFKAV